jgi:hypothetical protein
MFGFVLHREVPSLRRRGVSALWVSALCAFALCGAAAAATLPSGKKTITLVAGDGQRLPIGHVTFAPDADAAKVAVVLDAPQFAEEFLSMRPFRCLAGEKETWCHLPYPYQIKGRVSAADLIDLEYALLFLFKPPAGYGIDAWNGLYFPLTLGDDGSISRSLHEVDLNVLAVPPMAGNLRPVTRAGLTPVSADSHRFARIEIR